MPAISKNEAVERLAKTVEKASSDDLLQIFTELYPAESLPDVAGPKAVQLAQQLATHIRKEIHPEEVVDLWNVVFPRDWNVYWDEEADALQLNDGRLKYAEQ